jgi:hypothetical protein
MAGAKRKLQEAVQQEEEGEEEEGTATQLAQVSGATARKRRKLEFQDVTVFHFNRRQGFVCVPSQVNTTEWVLGC